MATKFGRKNPRPECNASKGQGHAGVSWGQPEGNCLEMRKAIKCSQCHRALCSCRCSSINNLQSKLRTYCLFKNQFCLENYVSMFSCQYRSVFTKLRISAHPLMIEKGHHFHLKIPVDQRTYLYFVLLDSRG